MARKRMIDPSIWESEDFAKLDFLSRLVWIGLFSNADDEGRGRANVSYIKSQIFPYDEELSLKKIENALKNIENMMSIQFYEVEGKKYYQLTKWNKFQTINRPSASQIPAMPIKSGKEDCFDNETSMNNHGRIIEQSRSNQTQIIDASCPKREEEKEREIEEEIKERVKERNSRFVPPTLDEVKNFAKEHKCLPMAQKFFDYYSVANPQWSDKNGKTILPNWKQKFIGWINKDTVDKRKVNFCEREYSKEEMNALFQTVEEIEL